MLENLFGKSVGKSFLSNFWPNKYVRVNLSAISASLIEQWGHDLKPEQLLQNDHSDIKVWNQVGSLNCDSVTALDLYAQGCALYIPHVERYVPTLRELIVELEEELGVPSGSGHCSVFAGRANSIVMPHCDHDYGFNLIVQGEKQWRVSEKNKLVFPSAGHQIGCPLSEDNQSAVIDQLPISMPDGDVFDLTKGGCIFLPPGVWHSTKCIKNSISLDFAIDPPTRTDLIISNLRTQLEQTTELRAPIDLNSQRWWAERGNFLVGDVLNSFTRKNQKVEHFAFKNFYAVVVSEQSNSEGLVRLYLFEDGAPTWEACFSNSLYLSLAQKLAGFSQTNLSREVLVASLENSI